MFDHEFLKFRCTLPYSPLFQMGRRIMENKSRLAEYFSRAYNIFCSMPGTPKSEVAITINPVDGLFVVCCDSQSICINAAEGLRYALATAIMGPYGDYVERHIAIFI